MKLAPPFAVAALALVAACGEAPDPWTASASLAAAAQPGAATLVRSFAAIGPECDIGDPPVVEIVSQGVLGAATVAPATETVVAPDQECDGTEAPATGVYYEAGAGASGVDRIVFREIRRPAAPDVVYTADIRVR